MDTPTSNKKSPQNRVSHGLGALCCCRGAGFRRVMNSLRRFCGGALLHLLMGAYRVKKFLVCSGSTSPTRSLFGLCSVRALCGSDWAFIAGFFLFQMRYPKRAAPSHSQIILLLSVSMIFSNGYRFKNTMSPCRDDTLQSIEILSSEDYNMFRQAKRLFYRENGKLRRKCRDV